MRFLIACLVFIASSRTGLCLVADSPMFVFGKESPPEWQQVLFIDEHMPQMRFAFSPEPNELVFFGSYRQVHFLNWRTNTTRMVETRLPASHVAFAPGRNEFLTAERTDGIAIRAIDTGREFARLKPEPVTHVREAIFLDADTVVAYAENLKREVRIEQLTSWSMNERIQKGWPSLERSHSHNVFVRAFFNSQGSYLIRVQRTTRDNLSDSRTVSTTDTRTNQPGWTVALDAIEDEVHDLSPDGRFLLASCGDQPLRIIDLESDNSVRFIESFSPRKIETAVFSPNGKLVLTASNTARPMGKKQGFPEKEATHLRLFRVETGEQIASLSNTGWPLDYFAVRFSADGKMIAAMTRPTYRGDVKEALRGGKMVLWGVPKHDAPQDVKYRPVPSSDVEVIDDTPTVSNLERLISFLARSSLTQEQKLETLYLAALSRYPTLQEKERAMTILSRTDPADATGDERALQKVLNTLCDSTEFGVHVESLRSKAKR